MAGTDALRKSKLPIIPLRFKTVNQLYRSYMPWFKNGGLFIPTIKRFQMGQEVLMMVMLPESKDKFPAAGIVSMGLPAEFYRTQKATGGVEFSDDEGLALRYRIDGML
jgi:type IV pilus assembly protein PilZ